MLHPSGCERQAHFRKARVHDVFAMPRAVEPTLHHLVDRLRAIGDILADELLLVTHRAYPIRWRVARRVDMLEVVFLGHIVGVT